MNYSTNYSMREPVPGEKVKVADINYNTEIIDGVMLDNRQISIDMYDDTSTYNTDDLAGHENSSGRIAVYRCLQDNTTGAWDSTKWVQTNLADEITDIRGNAGASDLGDLNDVDLTNPTEGQVLTYDDQNDEWVNSDLPDADVTKEASGNPIELTDAASAPLVRCVTGIVGSQDLHGYDKPWVGGAGKNKLENIATTTTVNGVTFTVNADGTVVANGTATGGNADLGLATLTLTEGQVLNGSAGGSGSTYGLGISGVGIVVGNGDHVITASESGNKAVYIRVMNGKTVSNVTFYPMLRASGTTADFAPYSNICPITAYTEGEIEVRGKNALDPLKVKTGFQYNPSVGAQFTLTDIADMTDNSDGTFSKTISGWYCFGYLFELTESECFFKIQYSGTGARVSYGFLDDSYTVLSSEYNSNTNQTITKSLAKTGTRKYFFFTATTNRTTADITFTEPQIEVGSSATDYEEFRQTTHTTTYPSAIFRGSEDVVNGKVSTTWIMTDLGDYTWVKGGTGRFGAQETRIKQQSSASQLGAIISSHYGTITANETYQQVEGIAVAGDTIFVYDANYASMTAEQFKTAITGVKCAFELATPTTSSVTPTNLPIKSLSGYNHIESSTGEMEIEYFPAKEQPLIDLIPEASNMHEYSTQEQIVGKWVDGKDVYEKTYVFSSLPRVNDWTAFDEDCGIDTLVDYSLMYTRSNGQIDNDSDELRVAYNPPTGLGDLCYYPGGVGATHITVRYTKTSSNNRSLAKSAPQEEQVEELKEEPTEETKEEVKEEPEEPVEEVKEVKEEETKEEGEVNER